MSEVESRLWWYRSLHHLVARALTLHPKGHTARIMDAGCGTGGLLMFLRNRGFAELSGFDVSADAVAICQERGLPVEIGDLRSAHHALGRGGFDAIISNDTLYFFNSLEQQQILRSFAEALAPDGLLIMNVPALRAFRGIHDMSVGISRRFTKPEVETLLSGVNLAPARIQFWPFLLSPFIYFARFKQRIRLRYCAPLEVQSDIDLPPAPLNRVLEGVTRFENWVLPWKPFGSSLFVVTKKLC